jgi:hypothetical protein
MKCNYQFVFCFLWCLSSFVLKAQDLDTNHTENFNFIPSFAGGQVELTTLFFVTEYGALVDFDIFKKKSKINYSFGARISFEQYSYISFSNLETEGPYQDYCLFLMHSGRGENIHFNILAGLAYFPEVPTYTSGNILFRVGFEFRFNMGTKIAAFIIKGASSFDSNTTYFGLGIALGYYK